MIACFLMPQIAIATERSRIEGLWGEPVALTGENEIVLCVSEEAKVYGVEPGQKSSGAKALCANLRLLPYERDCYEQAAALIWDALAVESSVVEPVSPEICYAEVDDRHVVPQIRSLTERLAFAAKMPIHAGLASSKIVARYAAYGAPPGEPAMVYPGCESSLLADVPIASMGIPDFDSELLRRLDKLGVRNLGDLHTISQRNLNRAVGKIAMRLSRIAIGLDGDPVRPAWPRPTLRASHNFDYEVTGVEPLEEALRRCSLRLSGALTTRHEFASRLSLRLIREDCSYSRQEERLPGPTRSHGGLNAAALRLLHRMHSDITRDEIPLTGVLLEAAGLTLASAIQLELIDVHGNQMPAETRLKLHAALEYLRSRFGIGAVLPGSALHRARRIDYWTSPFCHQLNEPVEVMSGKDGAPIRFWRRQKLYRVCAVLNDWCETCWVWNELIKTTVFRIETEPCGLFELRRFGASWRITAAQD